MRGRDLGARAGYLCGRSRFDFCRIRPRPRRLIYRDLYVGRSSSAAPARSGGISLGTLESITLNVSPLGHICLPSCRARLEDGSSFYVFAAEELQLKDHCLAAFTVPSAPSVAWSQEVHLVSGMFSRKYFVFCLVRADRGHFYEIFQAFVPLHPFRFNLNINL